MSNQIEKPVVLVREEFIKNLAQVINDSNLPAFVIEPILANVLEEVRTISKKQYELEKKQYEEAIKKAENEEAENANPKKE